jgi:hypothetical protein
LLIHSRIATGVPSKVVGKIKIIENENENKYEKKK